MHLETIKKRADFLRTRGGPRWSTPSFTLEARWRSAGAADAAGQINPEPEQPADAVARFGFTVTKKLGGAVVRNRIRRRLKAAVRSLSPASMRPLCDYVLIARLAALKRPFEELRADLAIALDRVNRRLDAGSGAKRAGGE